MLIYLNDENFSNEIKNGKVLVDFYADWCGPCKMISPLLEELGKINKNLKIIKVNVDKYENIAQEYGIMSIPTLILFEDGILKKQNVGSLTKDGLENFIK